MLYIVDYLKAFACLLIANFHSGILFPDSLSLLSFGGDIGNNIFFMLSGFTLYPSIVKCELKDLWKWYIKRLIKLLPILIFFYIISKIVRDVAIRGFISFLNVYWFTGAILLFYLLLFLVIKSPLEWMSYVICVGLIIFHFIKNDIIAERYYIGFMAILIGAELRRHIDNNKIFEYKEKSKFLIGGVVFSMIVYCLLKLLRGKGYQGFGIIHVAIGLMTLCIAGFSLILGYFNNEKIEKFSFNNTKVYRIIKWISSITLSVYIVQCFDNYILMNFINDKMKFPISYIVDFIIVFFVATLVTNIDKYFQIKIKSFGGK